MHLACHAMSMRELAVGEGMQAGLCSRQQETSWLALLLLSL